METGDQLLLETGDAILLEQQAGTFDAASYGRTSTTMMGVGG